MSYECVQVESEAAIRILRLNRPEARNAFNWTQMLELTEALHDADEDAEVRAVILTGSGSAFSDSLDLSFEEQQQKEKMEFARCLVSDGFRQGQKKFLERKPQ